MTTPAEKSLQDQITADEKAIRLLIGERAAVNSKLARVEAKLKLERTRLSRLVGGGRSGPLVTASRFPDVSNWEANINVGQVRNASSVRVGDLLVTKVTEGTGFVDRLGVIRLNEMSDAKFPHRGAYHFLHPSSSGVAQAQLFLATINQAKVKLGAADIAVCDLEVTAGASARQVQLCAKDFATEVRKHFSGKLWLYGGGPFLRDNGVSLAGYDGHWLAAYVGNPAPFEVYGKAHTVAWQYTDGQFGPVPHSCPGIGPCDLSIVL